MVRSEDGHPIIEAPDPYEQIGRHFQLWEALRSNTAARLGIDNTPDHEQLAAIRRVARQLMDPVRESFGRIRVNSWLRVPELNEAILGSSSTSAHTWGGAVDFRPYDPAVTLREIAEWIGISGLPFDQCIYEYGSWIHLGAARLGSRPRGQVLMKFKGSPYLPFDSADSRVVG